MNFYAAPTVIVGSKISQPLQKTMAIPIHSQPRTYSSNPSNNVIVVKNKKLKISNQNAVQPSNNGNLKYNQNIKEVMNTSAPLCISSYASNHTNTQTKRQTYTGSSISRMSKNIQSGVINGPSRSKLQTKQALNMTTVLNQNNSQEDIPMTINATLQDVIPHNSHGRPQSNNVGHRNNMIFYSAKQSCKYNEDQGFMRGARIAEKIQEFYTLSKTSQKPQNVNQSVAFNMSKQFNTNSQPQYNNKQRAVSSYGNSKRVNLQYQGSKNVSQNMITNMKEQQQEGYNRGSTQQSNTRSSQRDTRVKTSNRTQNYTMMIEENAKDYEFYPRGKNPNETMKVSDIIQSQEHFALPNQRNVFSNQQLPTEEQIVQPVVPNEQVSSNEIRKIKLNYIQLNKRAGTSYAIKRQNNTADAKPPLQDTKIDQNAKNEYTNQVVINKDLIKTQITDANQLVEKLFYNDLVKDDQGNGDPVEKHKENAQNLDSELYDMQFCTENSTSDNLDNYIIGKRIGQGAYAVVRIGLHKSTNQKIACKVYEKFKLLEPNRRKSVKREIKIMERLDHKNIAKLYEAFDTHKQVFLVMEFVNGGSLHGYLKSKNNRQMNEVEAKFLFRQVVNAIYFCHQRNVTHRDIKLENILLNEEKTKVKLIDFGFSTCIPNDRKVKLFCGTPSYMAPEIVSKKEYAGPPADIWALGVLFFALLCGKFPFRGQNDKELYKKICKYELEIPEHVSAGAKAFLQKILKKDPDQRPNSKSILTDPFILQADKEYEAMFFGQMNSVKTQPSSFAVSTRTNALGFNQTADVSKLMTKNSSQLIGTHSNSQERDKTLTAEQLKQMIKDQNKTKCLQQVQAQKDKEFTNISSFNHSLEKASEITNKKNRINMEAYQAYYNTSDQQTSHQQHQNPPAFANQYANESFPLNASNQQQQNLNIINNIMHINQGANVNIITQPNSQNNFIFNNTVPINLNFYKNEQLDLNNFDQQILKDLQTLYSYTEQEVITGLADTNSKISKIYQKLIDQKLMSQPLSKKSDMGDLQSLESSMRQGRQMVGEEKQRAMSHSIGRVASNKQHRIGEVQKIEDFQFSDSFEDKKNLNQTTYKQL